MSRAPAVLTVTVEPVVTGNGHPREGQFMAQARWEEETHTAFGHTPTVALLLLACHLNRETWPGDTATARALDPVRRIWPAPQTLLE